MKLHYDHPTFYSRYVLKDTGVYRYALWFKCSFPNNCIMIKLLLRHKIQIVNSSILWTPAHPAYFMKFLCWILWCHHVLCSYYAPINFKSSFVALWPQQWTSFLFLDTMEISKMIIQMERDVILFNSCTTHKNWESLLCPQNLLI